MIQPLPCFWVDEAMIDSSALASVGGGQDGEALEAKLRVAIAAHHFVAF